MIFEIVFWHWWTLGILLIIIELFAPGAFFLWMGISAFFIGVAMILFPHLLLEYQILGFSVLSVISIVLSRTYLKKNPLKTDHPFLNRRSAQYIGRVFTLDQPIVNGQGKIKVDDSIWKIQGEDCPANSRVKVISVNGTVLIVEPVDQTEHINQSVSF